MKNSMIIILTCIAVSSMGYVTGQMASKPIPKKIHGEKFILDSREQIPEAEIALPALSATRTALNTSTHQFFYAAYKAKESAADKAALLARAPAILLNQYKGSKSKILQKNPWFVLKGLQEAKTLLYSLTATSTSTASAAASQSTLQTSRLQLFVTSAYLPLQTLFPRLATLQKIKGIAEPFGMAWIKANNAQMEDLLLSLATSHIVNTNLLPEARELIAFIGVLGHALPVATRAISLDAIETLCINTVYCGGQKGNDLAESILEVIQKVKDDMRYGPDAKTIAEMTIRDRA